MTIELDKKKPPLKDFTIRSFDQSDMKDIADILRKIGWASQYVEGQQRYINKLIHDDEGNVYVSDKDGQVDGFIQVHHYLWNQLSSVPGLVVSPDYHRQGIGGDLMAYIEKESQIRGNRGVYVDTPVDNHEARAFYKAQGYAEGYIMPRYYEDGLDGVTYQKFFK